MIKKLAIISFTFLYSNLSFAQLYTTVYDLAEEQEVYIFGQSIPVNEGLLDQPNEIYYFDSIFIVKNTFGAHTLTLFDEQFNYLNSCLEKGNPNPSSLSYYDGKILLLNNGRLFQYGLGEMMTLKKPESVQLILPSNVSWKSSIHPYRAGELIIFTPEETNTERLIVLDKELREKKRLAPMSALGVDSILNNHLNATMTIDPASGHAFIGYRYTNYIEKFEVETGKLLVLAHEANSIFPPEHDILSTMTIASTHYTFFTRMKVYSNKLYVLYRYGVPSMPRKEDEKMRLLIFDTKNLSLERNLILDEDLEDFVMVGESELIGVCYYCEDPIRQYWLD